MRIVIVYKDASDHAREVIDYLRDFKIQTGGEIETIDPETKEGDSFCRAYDVVEYPSVLALDNSGALQEIWRGRPLPIISQLSYYNQ